MGMTKVTNRRKCQRGSSSQNK